MKIFKTLLIMAITCASLNAHAEWKCTVNNKHNEFWVAYDLCCDNAAKKAMKLCMENSCIRCCLLRSCTRH